MNVSLALLTRVGQQTAAVQSDWLTLARVKEQLIIEEDDVDDLLTDYLAAAWSLLERATGQSLDNHTRYYLYKGYKDACYLFNGTAADVDNIECRAFAEEKDFYDLASQDVVTHTVNEQTGQTFSVFISDNDKDYISVKVPVVWQPAKHPMIKTVLLTWIAEMYRNRSATIKNAGVNRVIYSQLASYRVI